MNLHDRITEAERLRRNNRALRNGDARQEWQVRMESAYKGGWKERNQQLSDFAHDVIWLILCAAAVLGLLGMAIQGLLS